MTWEEIAERPNFLLEANDTGTFVSFRMAEKYNMKLVYTKTFYDFFQDKAKETASLLYKMKALEVKNSPCWCSVVSILMAYAVIKWFSVLAFFVAIAKSCVVIGVCTIISFFSWFFKTFLSTFLQTGNLFRVVTRNITTDGLHALCKTFTVVSTGAKTVTL